MKNNETRIKILRLLAHLGATPENVDNMLLRFQTTLIKLGLNEPKNETNTN